MRNAFVRTLTALAREDERIVLLMGDIGNRMFDEFKSLFPTRFYNCGVAEANMTGLAAGLALSGFRPVTYTIAPFNSYRCFEQIRLDLCYQNVPVVVAGVGGGLSYAGLGATHHSCEDIACLRSLPNMRVLCPGDAVEVGLLLEQAVREPGPSYLRLGKKNEPVIHQTPPQLAIGKAIELRAGRDVMILNTGNTLPEAVGAADLLAEAGISAGVASVHTVKPLDTDLLARCFQTCRLVVSMEEHGAAGGFGGAIAEWMADAGPQKARLLRLNTGREFLAASGNQRCAREHCGLTAATAAARIREALG
ncbi:transketolase C-terminal domain-containing protein [Pseudodesulfovibrio sp.]|uniref:transketolase family protein n=1 Tax=Pseudodesulfovibrio sp. TaxID=2035812 RepID=UPI0026307052|nr:transketolase C-terminal domain-containing protein [Pseudodesulfovibrio sp.]MDD3312109.1 transketolase C-terminal domain-containing protein [Pseudodesulfovibrio sp.]